MLFMTIFSKQTGKIGNNAFFINIFLFESSPARSGYISEFQKENQGECFDQIMVVKMFFPADLERQVPYSL